MDDVLSRILSLLPKNPNGAYVRGCKKDLADSLGLPHNIIAEWVSGRNKSYMKYLHQIASHFDVSVSWLTGEAEQKEKPTPEGELDMELYSRLKELSGQELDEVSDYINYILSKRYKT